MCKIVNTTPHVVNVLNKDGNVCRSFEPVLSVRVSSSTEIVGELDGIMIDTVKFGDVEGLPAEKEGTFYIVSRLVKSALPNRQDLLVPNQQVRDEQGRVIGCRSLSIA